MTGKLGACSDCNVQKKSCKFCAGEIYWIPNSRRPVNYADGSLHSCDWRLRGGSVS